MSELPKCRLCKRPPVIIDETLLFHDTECDCPLWCAEEMSHTSWRMLMTQQQAEQVETCAYKDTPGRERYNVVRNASGFWPYCVKAGDGERSLYLGHKKACERVAAELATAFEDGRFLAGLTLTAQQPDQDRLRFQSACEISGEKHPEYVRGYEAAMDAVCNSQQAGEKVYLVPTGQISEGGFELHERHDAPVPMADFEVLYTAPQAQPAPIPTAERLPTEADADPFGNVLALDSTGSWDVWSVKFVQEDCSMQDCFFVAWLPTGLTKPPAPGGEG